MQTLKRKKRSKNYPSISNGYQISFSSVFVARLNYCCFLIDEDENQINQKRPRETPAQNKLKDSISKMQSQLLSLMSLKQSGMSLVIQKQIDDLKNKISDAEMNLNR